MQQQRQGAGMNQHRAGCDRASPVAKREKRLISYRIGRAGVVVQRPSRAANQHQAGLKSVPGNRDKPEVMGKALRWAAVARETNIHDRRIGALMLEESRAAP